MLITNISLALFEDTGWYKPDYSLAVDMWWGKGRGCDFIHHNKCPMGDVNSRKTGEFCRFSNDSDSYGCDEYGDDITLCSKTADIFSEGCPANVYYGTTFGDCD